jgi:GntR family transcriptional regulator
MASGGISRDDPRPLYKQVKDRLLERLADASLPPTAKLASERELVERYGVSRITIRQAMRELVNEGRLRSQPGKGFYATGKPARPAFELELLRSFTATAEERGLAPGSRLLHGRIEPAGERIAAALQLAPATPVVALRRLRLIDGVPVAVGEDWIEAARVPGLLALDWRGQNRSLYGELRHRFQLEPVRGETVLSARLADPEEAALLQLDLPAAVLTVEQVAYAADDRPINLTHSIHHPTRYPLRLEQGTGR